MGFAWTDKIETARMFASGLNAVGKGGALLRVEAPVSMIMTGPSKHSIYMGEREFTVDPRQLGAPSRSHFLCIGCLARCHRFGHLKPVRHTLRGGR